MALGADKGCKTRNGRQPRPVVCLETGEEYESVKAAAEALGRGESSIRASISRGVGGAGYHWAYRTDPKLECKLTRYRGGECNLRRGPCARPVICLETGEEFGSAKAAGEAMGLSHASIYRSIYSGGSGGGRHWAFADSSAPDDSYTVLRETERTAGIFGDGGTDCQQHNQPQTTCPGDTNLGACSAPRGEAWGKTQDG